MVSILFIYSNIFFMQLRLHTDPWQIHFPRSKTASFFSESICEMDISFSLRVVASSSTSPTWREKMLPYWCDSVPQRSFPVSPFSLLAGRRNALRIHRMYFVTQIKQVMKLFYIYKSNSPLGFFFEERPKVSALMKYLTICIWTGNHCKFQKAREVIHFSMQYDKACDQHSVCLLF